MVKPMWSESLSNYDIFFILVIINFFTSNSDALGKVDYPCPTDCDCFVFSESRNDVHVRCAVDVLNGVRFNFSMIQANHTAGLYLQCDSALSPFYQSHVDDYMFSHLVHLKVLEIHDCQITDISQHAFYSLTELIKLRIVRSKRMTFHVGVFRELPNLQHLEITGGHFVFIPPTDLCGLRSLFKVNFTDSRVRDISEVGLQCPDVLYNMLLIDMSSNFLTQLPADFSLKFPQLQQIYLKDNRISKVRQGTFKNMQDLQLLSLSKNFLASLPSDFLLNCTNVTGIGISTNELSRIPKGLLQRLPKLKIFEARNTFIGDSIWEELKGASSLEILDLGYIAMNYINATVMADLRQLKRLVLSGNRIKNLPNNVLQRQSKLELLYLQNNDIVEIGKNSLAGLRKLEALTLHNNNISNIHNAAFRKCADSLKQFLNLSSNSLTKVPKALGVLGNLVSLDLSGNRIGSINENSFEGLYNLLELHISRNLLKQIPQNVFQKCPRIIIINLSDNRISSAQSNVFGHLSELRYLWLDNNKLWEIDWVFANMNHLQFLNLSNNEISKPISPYLFPNTVEYLYLSGNKISNVVGGSFEGMDQLKLLDLSQNDLSVISNQALRVSLRNGHKPYVYLRGNPWSCTCQMAWLKYLVSGNLTTNSHYFQIADYQRLMCQSPDVLKYQFVADIPRPDFICYYTVNCLLRECPCCYFEGCDCKSVCPANCTCFYDQNWSVHVVNCRSSGLTALPPFLPQTMTKLYLDGNQLGNLDKHSFLARNLLSIIYLNNSQIQELDNKTFHGLPKLEILYLDNNNIDYLIPGVFNGLSILKELYLDFNGLSFIPSGVLDPLMSLQKLTLQGNKLGSIDNVNLPKPFHHVVLLLGQNPFVCACSQMDNIQSALNVFARNVKDLRNLTCVVVQNETMRNVSSSNGMLENTQNILPNNMVNSSVENVLDVVNNLDVFCPNSSTEIIKVVTVDRLTEKLPRLHLVLISVAGVIVVLTIFGLIIFAKRKLIQVWMYTKFGLRFSRPDSNFDKDKKYDAFISYSSRDEHFVVHELAPQLEQGNPAYKLCLHYRDFPVGAGIAENIIEAVESSRRTILILSTNFLQSEWCRFEFQSAHHQVLKDRLNRVIVILLNDFPFEKLDRDLKLYLKTTTYLKVGDPWFWQKLKYALPDITKPQPKVSKKSKKKGNKNGIGPSVYVVFGSNSSLHIYEEVQPD